VTVARHLDVVLKWHECRAVRDFHSCNEPLPAPGPGDGAGRPRGSSGGRRGHGTYAWGARENSLASRCGLGAECNIMFGACRPRGSMARSNMLRGRSPSGHGGGRASAAMPLLDDVATSPASRRIASARQAPAPKSRLIFARTPRRIARSRQDANRGLVSGADNLVGGVPAAVRRHFKSPSRCRPTAGLEKYSLARAIERR
jgi:hypothetical protein